MKNFNIYDLICDLNTMVEDCASDPNEYGEGRYVYSVMFNMHDKVVEVHAQWPMVRKIAADLLTDYSINDFEVTCKLYQSDTEDDSAYIKVLCNKAQVVLTCFLEHHQLVKMLTEIDVTDMPEDDLPSVEGLECTSCDKLFNLWRELTGWLM